MKSKIIYLFYLICDFGCPSDENRKKFLNVLPIILCLLLIAVHFGRANLFILQLICLLIPFLIFWKSKISARILQLLLVFYGLEWIRTLIYYANLRSESGDDWFRLVLILGVVAGLNFASILVFRSNYMRQRYNL